VNKNNTIKDPQKVDLTIREKRKQKTRDSIGLMSLKTRIDNMLTRYVAVNTTSFQYVLGTNIQKKL